MATKIRLKRLGAKKSPFYRIVIADSRAPRNGRFIEEIGYYNPTTDPSELNVKIDRAKHWLSTGAQPSRTVKTIFNRAGVYDNEEA